MARFMIGELPEGVKLAAKEFGERLFDELCRDRDRVTFASTCLSNGDQILKTKPNTDHDQPMPDDVRVIANEMREAFTVSRSTPAWTEAKDQVEELDLVFEPGLTVPCLGVPIFNDQDFGVIAIDARDSSDPHEEEVMPLPTRVTQLDLSNKIADVAYVVMPDGRTTICQLTMENGFTVRGASSCVSVENFNKALGEEYSYEKAFDEAWAFEGYLLAEDRYREARGDGNTLAAEQEAARRTILLSLMEVVNVAAPEELLERVSLAFKPVMTHPGLAPHQHRVVVEKEDLDDRLDKLNAFFGTSIFAELNVKEQGRLRRQAVAMRIYSEVLEERIDGFGTVLEIKP